eukprot:jgi/Ulvmu1/6171/UM028_0027.1
MHGSGPSQDICSQAAKRFGNSSIAKQAAEQAARLLFTHSHHAPTLSLEPADPLHASVKNLDSDLPLSQLQKPDRLEQQLKAVTTKSMQPFLHQCAQQQLDDNRSYSPPPQEPKAEELFSGRMNSHVTPEHHSESVCSTVVHGANMRFTERSPNGVRDSHLEAHHASLPDDMACQARIRAPSRQHQNQMAEQLEHDGVTHGGLPAIRPHSSLPSSSIAVDPLPACDVANAAGTTKEAAQLDSDHRPADPHGADAQAGCDATEADSPTPPAQTLSPDIPLHATGAVAQRPLSPVGKAIRRVPMSPQASQPPYRTHMKSRYLESADALSRSVSPSREAAHQRHYQWKLGKMHADVPDYKRSQPRMYESSHCLGTIKDQHVVTLKQAGHFTILALRHSR